MNVQKPCFDDRKYYMPPFDTLQGQMHNVTVDMFNIINNAVYFASFLQYYTSHHTQHLTVLSQEHSSECVRGITSPVEGFLSPHLITPMDLQRALTNLSSYLRAHHPAYYVAHPSPACYYTTSEILYMCTTIDRHVYLRVPIPLRSTPDIYGVFRAHSFPIPFFHSVDPASQSTNDVNHHYSRIMGL